MPASGSPSPPATGAASEPVAVESENPCPAEMQYPCQGPLDAGTYQTEVFSHGLTFTVPAGWMYVDEPGNLPILPAGGAYGGIDTGLSDDVFVLAKAVAPAECTGTPSTTIPQTAEGLVTFLTTNPHFTVTNVHPVSVGGLDGTALDLGRAGAGTDTCLNPSANPYLMFLGVDPSEGVFVIGPAGIGTGTVRIDVLADGDHALVVEVDDAIGGSTYGDGDPWLAAAQAVIDSFQFAAE